MPSPFPGTSRARTTLCGVDPEQEQLALGRCAVARHSIQPLQKCAEISRVFGARSRSICSDVGVYRPGHRSGETGILVANDPDSWREFSKWPSADESLWNRLRVNSAPVAKENSISARARDIKAVWTALVAGRVAENALRP